jgi:non-canonical purine NTP pyrophosphatase (RdgB/HAM1 family)
LRLLLATSNRGKIREIQAVLGEEAFEYRSLLDYPGVPEAEESGTTFAENARLKALHCSRHTSLPALADDSGLVVDALDGWPGIYSARVASTDPERISKLLRSLHAREAEAGGRPAQGRRAHFVCAVCLWFSNEEVLEAEGEVEGEIIDTPKGTRGFGYDPVFFHPPLGRTFAELAPEEKNRVSHRAIALRRLLDALARR